MLILSKISLIVAIVLALNILGVVFGARTVCLDRSPDLQPSAWKFNDNYKYVDSAADLPKSFGNLNFLEGNGIWYVEGTGSGKEVKLTSDPALYNSRSRSVKIYLKYYEKTPRRISLQPIKPQTPASTPSRTSGGSIMLLPQSTGNHWTEVSQEISPNESPIEISGILSSGQFILFEIIVIAIDTSLPRNSTIACMDLTVYAQQPPIRSPSGNSFIGTTTKSPSVVGTSTSAPASCPVAPQPQPMECKCNCNCNCNKLCD